MVPFDEIIQKVSGTKYPTINLIYSYIYLLKQKFAPTGDNTLESYIDLIYRPISPEDTNKTNDIDSNTDNNAKDSGSSSDIYQYFKKAYNKIRKNKGKCKDHKHKHRYKYKCRSGRGHRHRCEYECHEYSQDYSYDSQQESEYDGDFAGLIKKFQATIYLFLNELWNVSDDIAFLAIILNPRLKGKVVKLL